MHVPTNHFYFNAMSRIRAVATPALMVMAALWASACARAADDPPTDTSTLANYTFATELGSGIYEDAGRTIQVYRLPFQRVLRPATPPGPALNLTLPVTVGFFDFAPADVLRTRIPTSIDTLSFVPGLELEYMLDENWHVFPYAKLGASFASSAEVSAVLFGLGVRSEYEWTQKDWANLLHTALTHAVSDFRGNLPSDAFTRLRNGLETRRGVGRHIRRREIELGVYSIVDVYFDSPESPVSGVSTPPVQIEAGLMFGVLPMWQVRGFTLPRMGLGYRFAGDFSGWRLVLGAPF